MYYRSTDGNFCDKHANAVNPEIILDYNKHVGYADFKDRMIKLLDKTSDAEADKKLFSLGHDNSKQLLDQNDSHTSHFPLCRTLLKGQGVHIIHGEPWACPVLHKHVTQLKINQRSLAISFLQTLLPHLLCMRIKKKNSSSARSVMWASVVRTATQN
jgi:hypothetical protein